MSHVQTARSLVEEAFHADVEMGSDVLSRAEALVSDVPLPWLAEAVRAAKLRTSLTPKRLRLECAYAVARACARVARDDLDELPEDQTDVEGLLRWAREKVPLGEAQLVELIKREKPPAARADARVSAQPSDARPPRPESTADALGDVLGATQVDGGLDATIRAIWSQGTLVPGRHTKAPDSIHGRQLATILGRIRHRMAPVVNGRFTDMDLDTLVRAMERFEENEPESDTAWWHEARPLLAQLAVKYDSLEQRGTRRLSLVPEMLCRRVYAQLWGDMPREEAPRAVD